MGPEGSSQILPARISEAIGREKASGCRLGLSTTARVAAMAP
jgi:hypothetical protein